MNSLGEAQTSTETPSYTGVLQAAINALLLQVNTILPGTVESFNKLTGTASVQPAFKRKYKIDGEFKTVDLPLIQNVPIVFPRAGDAALTLPIKKGDKVLIMVAQRSLDRWKKSTSKTVEVGDPRIFNIVDAIAMPGLYSSLDPIIGYDPDNPVLRNGVENRVTVKKDAIEITSGIGKIEVSKTGKFKITNGGFDVLALMQDFLTQVEALKVPTAMGISGEPINKALLTAIRTKLEQLIG